jgi:hypothetical protein
MPQDFTIAAMRFTGPSGDGRRGSAGFVVKGKKGEATRLSFSFQRDATGYGFQVIHPLGKGRALVSVQLGGVTFIAADRGATLVGAIRRPYRSKWIEGHGGGRELLYATYGNPIVSIFGRQGSDLNAIGFGKSTRSNLRWGCRGGRRSAFSRQAM